MNGERVFADTNVFAYALDTSDPAKQRRAQHVLTAHGADLVISTQVLIELYAVCVRKLGMDAAAAAGAVRAASRVDVVPADRDLMLDAVALATERAVSVFDAAIACAAVRAQCTMLLSEDSALGTEIRGIPVVDPFTGA